MADIFSATPQMTARQRYAQMLMQQGADASPVQHPLQAVARALAGGMGGFLGYQAEQEAKTNAQDAINSFPGMAAPPQTAPAAPQPISNPMGSTPVAGADMNMPRGLRNNNALNIEDGPFARSQPGYAGSDGRFAKFASADGGIGAANALLDTYQNKHGLNTINGIVNRWAPSSDGNNTQAYAANVAKQVGIGPDDPIPPELRPKIIAAMGQHENGRPIQMAQASPQGQPQQPARSMVNIPPEVQSWARATMAKNPAAGPVVLEVLKGYAKPTDQYAPITDAKGNVIGQRSALTGEVKADPRRSEYSAQKNEDGTFTLVNKNDPSDFHVVKPPTSGDALIDFSARKTGAEAAAKLKAERAVTQPEREANQKKVADIVTTDIDRAIKGIDTSTLPTTGAVGGLLSNLGGTAARDVRGLIDTVRANLGFEELNKMRQASPTGGALGNVTVEEIRMLQATVGNLEQSQTADQLKDNLRRAKNTYLDIIHGAGKGPPREKLGYEQGPQEQAAPDRSAIESEMRRRGLLK